ncbi:MAG: protease complex subunit PrcB family protein [Deltaproteobacteria bacterium]
MKNKCKFSEKLYMYIENQTDEQQKIKLFEHIQSCHSCKEEYEILNSIQNELEGFEEVQLPEGYHQKLHMKLVKASIGTSKEEKKNFIYKFLPAAAALLVLVVTVKGISLYNAINTKNDSLASTAGTQMDNLSMDDARIKNNELAKLKEKPKAMKMPENSVEDNKLGKMNNSASMLAEKPNDLKAYNDSAAAAENMKMGKGIEPRAYTASDYQNQGGSALTYGIGDNIKEKGLQSMKNTEPGFETIMISEYCGINEPNNAVVQNKEKFEELWKLTNSGVYPVTAAPEIDFEKNTIVAVYMGQKPTGGYRIEITKIEENEQNVVVTVKETMAQGDSILTNVLTSPVHIVKIKKTDKQIIFKK